MQPEDSFLFSHSLIPIRSGVYGSYSIVIEDESCEYNKEIIVLDYRIISETEGPGFDLVIADESNIISIIITICLCLFFYHQNK